MRLGCVVAWLLAGCGRADEPAELPAEEEQDGACGDVDTFDAEVLGKVVDGGAAVEGATVTLEDRGWEPITVLGTATTGANGRFTLDAVGVTAVEDCWGTLLDYVLVAEMEELKGEKPINSYLHTAYDTDGVADVTLAPIELE